MKKIPLFILALFILGFSFGQGTPHGTPNYVPRGNVNTTDGLQGLLQTYIGIADAVYSDTITASSSPQNIKNIPFCNIATSDGNKWFRSADLSHWVKISTGSASIPTLLQVLAQGNTSYIYGIQVPQYVAYNLADSDAIYITPYGIGSVDTSTGNQTQIRFNNPTNALNILHAPDSSGTIALLSNLSSAQNLQQVLAVGNTADNSIKLNSGGSTNWIQLRASSAQGQMILLDSFTDNEIELTPNQITYTQGGVYTSALTFPVLSSDVHDMFPAASGTIALTSNIPSQFNPIAGTNVTLSGTYPNITFNASGGGGSQTFQQTLTAGSTLTTPDTVNQAGNNFIWTGGGDFQMDSALLAPTAGFLGLSGITTYMPFGDSYTAQNGSGGGFNVGTFDSIYAYRLAYSAFNNIAVIDSGVAGYTFPFSAAAVLRNINYNSNRYVSDMCGFNNIRNDSLLPGTVINYPMANTIKNGFKTVYYNQFSGAPISASSGSVTRTGTWSLNYNAQSLANGKTTTAATTSTAGSSITATETGTSVGLLVETPETGANITINVDGSNVPSYTNYSLIGQYDSGASSYTSYPIFAYAPVPIYITGLTNTSHTIKITTNNGGFLIVDYFAGLQSASSVPGLLFYDIPQMDSTGYALHGGSLAACDTMNRILDSLFTSFPSGYPFTWVHSNSFYHAIAGYDLSTADHEHPNDLGHSELYQGAVNAFVGAGASSNGTLNMVNNSLSGYTDLYATSGVSKILIPNANEYTLQGALINNSNITQANTININSNPLAFTNVGILSFTNTSGIGMTMDNATQNITLNTFNLDLLAHVNFREGVSAYFFDPSNNDPTLIHKDASDLLSFYNQGSNSEMFVEDDSFHNGLYQYITSGRAGFQDTSILNEFSTTPYALFQLQANVNGMDGHAPLRFDAGMDESHPHCGDLQWNGKRFKITDTTGGVNGFTNTIAYLNDTSSILATQYYVSQHSGGGSGTVTSIATASGILGGTITTTGTLKADTSLLATQYYVSQHSSGTISAVTAGIDLTGGGTSGTVTLSADTTTGSTKLATQGYVLRNSGGGGGGSYPANQVVYGTGSGATSSTAFTFHGTASPYIELLSTTNPNADNYIQSSAGDAALYFGSLVTGNNAVEFNMLGAPNQALYFHTNGATSMLNYYTTSAAPSISAGAGAGTSPTVSVSGTNEDGVVTVTTGTLPTLGATAATITFSSSFAFPTDCSVTLTPGNSSAALLSGTTMVYTTGNTSTWIITAGTAALGAATTYIWNYHIGGF